MTFERPVDGCRMRIGTMGRITSSSATIERLAVVAASQMIGLAATFEGPLAAAGAWTFTAGA